MAGFVAMLHTWEVLASTLGQLINYPDQYTHVFRSFHGTASSVYLTTYATTASFDVILFSTFVSTLAAHSKVLSSVSDTDHSITEP
jgi:hypothetical protein